MFTIYYLGCIQNIFSLNYIYSLLSNVGQVGVFYVNLCKFVYLESGSKNRAMMMVASTMHVRYMVLISNISESGGLSKLSIAWLPITQKFEPHNRNSSSDSIVLLSPLPPPWAPLDNTAHTQTESPVTRYNMMRLTFYARPPLGSYPIYVYLNDGTGVSVCVDIPTFITVPMWWGKPGPVPPRHFVSMISAQRKNKKRSKNVFLKTKIYLQNDRIT